ncbi:MAG: hypothetical protein KDE00_03525 [Rhodobacteraceae bacterium]|nr:hypothetical protein [Paracoccaceae bacterium]
MALLCIPPLLSLRACLKRAAYLRLQDRPPGWTSAGAAFSVGALVYNTAIVVQTFLFGPAGELVLGRAHTLAAILAWTCFCIWIFMKLAYHHRRRLN